MSMDEYGYYGSMVVSELLQYEISGNSGIVHDDSYSPIFISMCNK